MNLDTHEDSQKALLLAYALGMSDAGKRRKKTGDQILVVIGVKHWREGHRRPIMAAYGMGKWNAERGVK